jgi:hypothetical protein
MIEVTEFEASLECAKKLGSDACVDWLANWALIELQRLQVSCPNIKRVDPICNIQMFGKTVDQNWLIKRYLRVMYGVSIGERYTILTAALFYMFEALSRNMYIDSFNFGVILVGSLMLAMKAECDKPYTNSSFAFLAHLPLNTINRIERMILGACFIVDNEFTPEPPQDEDRAKVWHRWIEANPFPVNFYDNEVYKMMHAKIEYLFEDVIIAEADD